MHKISAALFATLIFSSVTAAQITRAKIDALHLPWIKFDWQGDSLSNRYFDKLAITIPVKIDSLPYNNLIAQFDLGADTTVFYGNSLTPFLNAYPWLLQKIDTTRPYYNLTDTYKGRFLKGVNLTLDKILFPGRNIAFINRYGDSIPNDSVKTHTPKIIGTLAPDLFQDKMLVIDYPNQRICVLDTLPGLVLKSASFVPVSIRKGRIKIPVTVESKVTDIMFDTGSSIFPIYASEENSAFFTDSTQPVADSLIGQQWGQKIAIYGKKINREIRLGKFKMAAAIVYYINDKSQKKFEDEEKITGLTGNIFFLNNVIIIDYRNRRFGIM